MDNKIYYVSSKEMIEIKKEIYDDNNLFVGEIDGKDIKHEKEYFDTISKVFQFPSTPKGFYSYYDSMTDLGWLHKEGYVLIINNYTHFLCKEPASKKDLIYNLNDFLLPFWEKEVEEVVVGGKVKPFNVYLVD